MIYSKKNIYIYIGPFNPISPFYPWLLYSLHVAINYVITVAWKTYPSKKTIVCKPLLVNNYWLVSHSSNYQSSIITYRINFHPSVRNLQELYCQYIFEVLFIECLSQSIYFYIMYKLLTHNLYTYGKHPFSNKAWITYLTKNRFVFYTPVF